MARVGVEKLLERLLGVKGLRVRGARFEPRGVVVEALPPRRKARCGVCGRPCPRYDSCPPSPVAPPGAGAYGLLVELRAAPCGVPQLNRRLYRAYLLKESLARGMDYRQPERASAHLDGGCQWAVRSKLKSFVRLAKTVRRHKQAIVAYNQTGLSNGVVEGLNNKIRLVMCRAYGFRNTAALKAMILLCCGGLTLHPPLPGLA